MTGSSTFSLIGNDMIESMRGSDSRLKGKKKKTTTKTTAQAAVRGWDWRAGLPHDAKGSDVLRSLRLGLAKALSVKGLV